MNAAAAMDAPLVAARFVHLATTLTLFGATLFAAAIAPVDPLLRRIAAPLALLSLLSAAAWLVFVAREMNGGDLDLAALGAVLTDTAFGWVWRARLALLAGLWVATLFPDRRWRLPALLAGLSVASLGLVGHATMQDGALGAAHRLNRAVHLVAVAFWLGGLPPFLAMLSRFMASPDRRDAMAAMMTFSRIGHFAVAAVFASGALEVALTVGAFPWPANTPYRVGLDAKILVFAAMTAVALTNRYALAPQVGKRRFAAPALCAGALAEIALGLGAIALVSVFATYDPHTR